MFHRLHRPNSHFARLKPPVICQLLMYKLLQCRGCQFQQLRFLNSFCLRIVPSTTCHGRILGSFAPTVAPAAAVVNSLFLGSSHFVSPFNVLGGVFPINLQYTCEQKYLVNPCKMHGMCLSHLLLH